jgi:CMP-N,N'-diacetyllegionaminic acid synthase
MRIVGIIPARGGSKGIPRKCITPCAGRPLLEYSCIAALGAVRLEATFLSTDDEEIARVGRAAGLQVPFMRPPELARDETPMIPVLKHALGEIENRLGKVDALLLLQPTSPLRESRHIDEAITLFESSGAETVVSIQELPHHFSPVSALLKDEAGWVSSYLENSGATPLRRQDKPKLFARNGPSILIVKPSRLEAGSLYGLRTMGYLMPKPASIDIDDAEDLVIAEALLEWRRAHPIAQ